MEFLGNGLRDLKIHSIYFCYRATCKSHFFSMHVQKAKPKMGMVESAKFLLTSRYIRDLATLVVAYGISINLVEVTWKGKLKAQVHALISPRPIPAWKA